MGELQTFFYLALLGGGGVAVWLVMIGVALRLSLRGLRTGEHRLTFALTASAALITLAFVTLGLVGAAVSVVRYSHGT
jgi:hypothetical protein